MSILDVAQEYHHRALKLSEEFSDTSKLALKNYVKSLNGLGNIYMSLGNFERADSVLRLALKGEQKLNSAVGQAIDNANLGSIFEHRGKLDSARVYYLRSMEFNKAANEVIGIALCHTYWARYTRRPANMSRLHVSMRQLMDSCRPPKMNGTL